MDTNTWISLFTLIALEVVLGIDNIIFISILALSFLLLIGFTLLIEGFDVHVPKGYVYFAMAFALLVDILQMKTTGRRRRAVQLNEHFAEEENPLKN